MRFPLLFLLAIFPLVLASQSFEVTGSVRDAEGNPLPFANVILLKASDNTQVNGISADDEGRFTLKGIPEDVYYLQAKYFGYKSTLVALEIKINSQIGDLVLEPDSEWLDEVVVTVRKPTV